MSGGGTRSGRRRTGGGAGVKPSEEPVRGIPQSEIDKLRGVRGHLEKDELTWQKIQEDYKRIGKDIPLSEAQDIRYAIIHYTQSYYKPMREAAEKKYAGGKLDEYEQWLFDTYQKMREYTKIAPTYGGKEKYIYRGISLNDKNKDYFNSLLKSKHGNRFDFDKYPGSFSTLEEKARDYAGSNGIVLRVSTSKIKNATSIRGISDWPSENEVLVSDNFKFSKITTANGLTYIDME